MQYDIIFITGEAFFDHPLSGIAILKRWLEKNGFTVGIIEMPYSDSDITKLGKPKLFFGITSGSIDSMLRNYNALKRPRIDDPHDDEVHGFVPDRAVIVYSNWVRKHFKESILVLGGTEATLRRFTHYDYWDNKLRKPILVDSRADILSYGNSEKQIVEIANRLKKAYEDTSCDIIKARGVLNEIPGTCVMSKIVPANPKFTILPSHDEVEKSKEAFCDMQNAFSNIVNLAERVVDRYVLQYASPKYTSSDLDEYYELEYTREIPDSIKYLRGFEFSVVTHRGCVGNCNFCSLTLTQGDKIISRSEESLLKELEKITKLPYFRGNIDDFGGPAANMYGMDCVACSGACMGCSKLVKDNHRLIELMRKARAIPGIEHIYVKSGIRYDLCSDEYLKELVTYHVADTLRIAPEHTNKEVLKLMNKNYGDLNKFISDFNKINATLIDKKELSFYFMTAHPGSTVAHAEALAKFLKDVKNAETIQIFTPTPMTVSTCMYYTSMEPKTKRKIYVPYAFTEKKEQRRAITKNFKQDFSNEEFDEERYANKFRNDNKNKYGRNR